jgi:hypothetical protein
VINRNVIVCARKSAAARRALQLGNAKGSCTRWAWIRRATFSRRVAELRAMERHADRLSVVESLLVLSRLLSLAGKYADEARARLPKLK